MKLHELGPAAGSTTAPKRLGRGVGSGLGKTSGKGHKGANIFRTEYATVNVGQLEVFDNGTVVTAAMLKEAKIIRKTLDGVKVLGNGELTKKLTVEAAKFTASAKEKIEALGGKAEVK